MFMDFNIRKPLHIFAFIIILFAFFLIVVFPIMSFFFFFSTTGEITVISEFAVLLGSIITVMIFVVTPLIWYLLVNNFGIKEIFGALKLRMKRIDEAFLWGVVTAVAMFIMVAAIGYLLYASGLVDPETDISNIEDLARNLSVFSMFFIIVFQSISEEIFFRGFLLEKIDSFAGKNVAILITAILFGLAHMSYGKLYPTFMPMLMGVFLGYIVIKTKNLYAAITAHMLFNLASFIFYLFAKSLTG